MIFRIWRGEEGLVAEDTKEGGGDRGEMNGEEPCRGCKSQVIKMCEYSTAQASTDTKQGRARHQPQGPQLLILAMALRAWKVEVLIPLPYVQQSLYSPSSLSRT